ncbi:MULTISPECIES: cytochrome b/b6 domain-containing protein [Thalassospira]|uniref:Uncharacterized protein n=1 Tax=Thalassospira profundimaris TaxID=502049 RepID=A0A367V7C0_9PROT|nr:MULTISPECIES: cytochrome b/b6 domain-containing protein [Thalassospira]KZB73269.1 hypothetical protein AUQ43_18505 [Thalassospira sp. MCCC 1A01148]RCK21087.1 hypothetical protein TH6_15085 [Thalassospira profundimaris]
MAHTNHRVAEDRVSLFICAIVAGFCGAALCFILLVISGTKFVAATPDSFAGFFKTAFEWQALIGGLLTFAAAMIAVWLTHRHFNTTRISARAKARAEALIGLSEAFETMGSFIHSVEENTGPKGPREDDWPGTDGYKIDLEKLRRFRPDDIIKVTPLIEYERNPDTRRILEEFTKSYAITVNRLNDFKISYRNGKNNTNIENAVSSAVETYALASKIIAALQGDIGSSITNDDISRYAAPAGVGTASKVEKMLYRAMNPTKR